VIYPNAETADKSNRRHFEKDKKYLVNAGSVGQPRDGDNRLCFCLYDTIEQNIEFIRLNYDIKVTSEKIISSGLPPFLAERLINGY
jgi:diadenosine tetraphosphatase ApaH/serine/threonine PP2A family protein phosphatase